MFNDENAAFILRLYYEGQLENMFAAHIFYVLYFRSDKNISDLTVMGSSYFTSWYLQVRYLSYPGTNSSILCRQKFVSYVNSYRVTSISTSRFSLHLWPGIQAPIISSPSFYFLVKRSVCSSIQSRSFVQPSTISLDGLPTLWCR
jgi:hypothetical protein